MSVKSRRAINFKHVGTKITDRKFTESVPSPSIPLGIKTPLRLGIGQSNLFDMHFQPASQIHDNLKNLITTNHGERLGRYNFGANLKSLSFDLAYVGDFEQSAITNIRRAVEKSMPVVEVVSANVVTTDHEKDGPLPDNLAKILLTISYNIPRLKVVERKLQVIIYAGG